MVPRDATAQTVLDVVSDSQNLALPNLQLMEASGTLIEAEDRLQQESGEAQHPLLVINTADAVPHITAEPHDISPTVAVHRTVHVFFQGGFQTIDLPIGHWATVLRNPCWAVAKQRFPLWTGHSVFQLLDPIDCDAETVPWGHGYALSLVASDDLQHNVSVAVYKEGSRLGPIACSDHATPHEVLKTVNLRRSIGFDWTIHGREWHGRPTGSNIVNTFGEWHSAATEGGLEFTINLWPPGSPPARTEPENHNIPMFLRPVSGGTMTLSIDPDSDVDRIFDLIADRTGVPTTSFRLQFFLDQQTKSSREHRRKSRIHIARLEQ